MRVWIEMMMIVIRNSYVIPGVILKVVENYTNNPIGTTLQLQKKFWWKLSN